MEETFDSIPQLVPSHILHMDSISSLGLHYFVIVVELDLGLELP